ncbi:hypothetical protein RW115_00685 [Macrococcus capreoli]
MTYYYFIGANVEIDCEYLKAACVEMDEKLEGSKCEIQYILGYNPSVAEMIRGYEELKSLLMNNRKEDYIVLEIAFGLSAYGTPLKVDKVYEVK